MWFHLASTRGLRYRSLMHRYFIGLLVGLSCFSGAALAVSRVPVDSTNKPDLSKASVEKPMSADDRAAIAAQVENYLTNISSIVADFTQTSADGSIGAGKFFLKRPGKMRWQYNPPTPLLLLSDGKVVTYYDAGLDQVTYIGIDDTLAGFLTKKDIKLESDSIKLTELHHHNGVISVTIVQRKKPADGNLTLEFTDKPLEIKRMVAVDATGNATNVQFQNARFGPVIDDKLFIFEDPRGVNHRRNKKSGG